MKIFSAIGLGIFMLTGSVGVAHADTKLKDPTAWINRVGEALESRNYRGTFVYLHDETLETMEIVHVKDEQGERERLYSMNGTPREIVRDNEEVKCFFPDDKAVVVGKGKQESPLPRALIEDAAELQRNYEFVDIGYSRIAGRYCRYIGIKPRDEYRYGYRICVDKESGLPLKTELVDENGKAIEQVMFTALELDIEIRDEWLQASQSGEGFRWIRQPELLPLGDAVEDQWHFNDVPEGFAALRSSSRRQGKGGESQQLVFSDGLASVSVFAEPVDADKPRLDGLSSIGAVNAFGRTVNGHQITVVGEVPKATVEMIGRAIEFSDSAQE